MNSIPIRRLIEDWLPVNEISVEGIREGGALAGHPPVNQLHVWWARRPLIVSRAAVAASILPASANHTKFTSNLGTSAEVVEARRQMDEIKATGMWSNISFPSKRSFLHNPEFIVDDQEHIPTILDITAGGGSIPFEAGRLGIKTIANELNPVAGVILRATCEWPQVHGYKLLDEYSKTSERFLSEVRKLTKDLYPDEPQPKKDPKRDPREKWKRETQTYLFARTVKCPSCEGTIPLSPNWRLDSKGTGIRIIPDVESGTCSFEVVNQASDHSPGSVSRAKATCPYPNCGVTTPAGYIPDEAQAGRLGQQPYCIIYRDYWYPLTKSGRPAKRPKTARGFRIPNEKDFNDDEVTTKLQELKELWQEKDILPTEEVPHGDDQRPHNYGMPRWRDMFSPRQLLAHGYCVQAFRELVDEDKSNSQLNNIRRAAWCYVALAVDKLINNNSVLCRWHANRQVIAGTFDSHDFGMKWSYAEMADQQFRD